MTPIAQPQFAKDLLQLLKETFEGPEPTGPSAFLDKGTGLFQTLDDISAEVASAQPRPGGSTIAAHTEHIRFYVAVHHKLMLGARDKLNWDDSWRLKTVSAVVWDDLKRDLRKAYSTINQYLTALNSWGEDEFSLAMAIVAHTGYHLGAIRQLRLAVHQTKN